MSRKEIASITIVCGVAILVRIWGIGFGLPYDFHPDEPFIIKKALNIIINKDFNPHVFTWPPLFIYLNAPLLLFLLPTREGLGAVSLAHRVPGVLHIRPLLLHPHHSSHFGSPGSA